MPSVGGKMQNQEFVTETLRSVSNLHFGQVKRLVLSMMLTVGIQKWLMSCIFAHILAILGELLSNLKSEPRRKSLRHVYSSRYIHVVTSDILLIFYELKDITQIGNARM